MNTVIIRSIDRIEITKAVQAYAGWLRKEFPEINRLFWFGSWVHGYPSPGSDVDLCLIVAASNIPMRDRISPYLPVGFPVGIDLCVYTLNEFEELGDVAPGWKREILKGIEL